jgi:hypothetical protein
MINGHGTVPYIEDNYTYWPSEAAWTEAAYYRGSGGYQFLYVDSDEGITNLKRLLAAGNLAVTTVNAYRFVEFTDNDVLVVDRYGRPPINHAAAIVGYNDSITYIENGQNRSGAFKVANSWGIGTPHLTSIINATNWEHVVDGCYWISYETMKQSLSWCAFFEDRIGYEPTLLAKFQIDHPFRQEVSITVGLGTPNATIARKVFSHYEVYSDIRHGYVFGGGHSFCPNKIVLDISEFLNYVPDMYHQPFYFEVNDGELNDDTLSYTLGNITHFSIQDVTCDQTPIQTRHYNTVYLTLNYSVANASLSISPGFGSPSGELTLDGVGFTPGGSVTLSYLNPVTRNWATLTELATATHNFSYILEVPDLLKNNPPVDHTPLSDVIVFRAQDNVDGYTCNASTPYTQWRRGLTQLGSVNAAGVFGNNTDLSDTVNRPKRPITDCCGEMVLSGQWNTALG